jgi:hypothetical protein
MPGLAIDPSQIRATIPTQRCIAPTNPSIHDARVFIKDEDEHDLDVDDYDDDEATYKPRPQLPKPFVHMRSLAHLIST